MLENLPGGVLIEPTAPLYPTLELFIVGKAAVNAAAPNGPKSNIKHNEAYAAANS